MVTLPTENDITALQRVVNILLKYPAIGKEIVENRTAASVILTGQKALAGRDDTSGTNYTGAVIIAGFFIFTGFMLSRLILRQKRSK